MEPRTFVSFEWGAPDPDQDGPDGEVVPGGKSILEAVQAQMARRGFSVTAVEPHESYGWCFDTQIGDTRVSSMIQFSEPWLLITDAPLGFFQRVKGRSVEPALWQVCSALNQCLRELPLASNVQWFTRREFQENRGKGGAAAP